MKCKRILSLILTISIIASLFVFVMPAYASDASEPFIDYIVYNDFSSADDLKEYRSGSSHRFTSETESFETYDSVNKVFKYPTVHSLDNGVFKTVVAPEALGYETSRDRGVIHNGFQTSLITGKPKLVFSYRVKLDFKEKNAAYGFGTIKSGVFTAINTVFFDGAGTMYPDVDKGSSIGSYTQNEWVTVSMVYDNDATNLKDKRDIYINGEYKGTYESATNNGYGYMNTGTVFFYPRIYATKDSSVAFEDIMIYALPDSLKYKISKIAYNKIELDFNMIPDIDTIISANFEIEDLNDNPVVIKSVKPDSSDPRKIYIEFDEVLKAGEEYKINVENITSGKAENDVIGTELTLDDSNPTIFATKPYKNYADNFTLSNAEGSIDKLEDGELTVSFNYTNESNAPVKPVVFAGLYSSDNELKSLFTKEFTVEKEKNDLPLSMGITVDNSANYTLKLFAVKGNGDYNPVSSLYTFDKNGANTPETYDSQKSIYKDLVTHKNKVDGDTYKINTTIDNYIKTDGRESAVLVLKEGKTLANIDFSKPMETLVFVDFALVSENGFEYKIPDVRGDYPSFVYVSNANNSSSNLIEYYGKVFIDAGKEIVKNIEENEVDSFLVNYEKVYSIDLTSYNNLVENHEKKEKTTFAKSVVALRKEQEDKEFTLEEFFEAFDEAMEIASIRSSDDVGAVAHNLQNGPSKELIGDKIISSETVSKIYDLIYQDKPLTKNEMQIAFDNYVILRGIADAESYSQSQIIMEKTKNITNVDLSKYNQLNDKKAVDLSVTGVTYSSVADLVAAYENAATNQYNLEHIILPPSSGTPTVGGGGGGGSTTISSPIDKIEISPDIETTKTQGKFTDLEGFDWAKDAINNLYDKGIVNGISEIAYNPSGEVKREEFVKMIDTLYSSDSEVSSFNDVNQNEWYASYINKAVAAGIIKGMNVTTFGLGQGVTREDMAVMIVRALKLEPDTSGVTFSDDSEIASYAKEAVYTLRSKGIISGTGNGNYEPKRIMTRAEAAVLINNILNVID